MNDERLEAQIRAALLRDEPGQMPADLRELVAGVPDEGETRARGYAAPSSRGASRWMASLRAVAAVVVVGAIIVAALSLRGANIGPGATVGTSSATPATTAVATPATTSVSPAPSASASSAVAPAPSATTRSVPGSAGWAGLRWSAPLGFPIGGFPTTMVSWNGQLISAGQLLKDGSVAFWRSSNETDWSRIAINDAVFAGSQVNRLVATPSGLLAWGTVGQPTCSGQGEGSTCGATPVMIWTSSDGTNWARIADASTFSGATISAVAAGPNGLVAVGNTGPNQPAIWVSATGAIWTHLSLPTATFKDASLSGVSATKSGYVLAGQTTTAAAAWWSADGRAWTRATVQRVGGVGTSLGTIYVGADGMVAVGSASGGNAGTAWTSPDGRSWQPIAPGYAGAPSAAPGGPTLPSFTVFGDGTHLVAVSSAGGLKAWTSTDGVAWKPLTFSGTTATIPTDVYSAFVVRDGLIVVGQTPGSGQTPFWLATGTP